MRFPFKKSCHANTGFRSGIDSSVTAKEWDAANNKGLVAVVTVINEVFAMGLIVLMIRSSFERLIVLDGGLIDKLFAVVKLAEGEVIRIDIKTIFS